VIERTRQLFAVHRRQLFGRLVHPVRGRATDVGGVTAVVAEARETGFLLVGPYVALPPGRQTAVFTFLSFRSDALARAGPDECAAVVDLCVGEQRDVVAERCVLVRDLPRPGRALRVKLPFDLAATTFGCETRVRSTGRVALAVVLGVEVLVAGGADDDGGAEADGGPGGADESVPAPIVSDPPLPGVRSVARWWARAVGRSGRKVLNAAAPGRIGDEKRRP
jgi:hypothetical protein